MAEPTEYDKLQDQRLDDLEDITTVSRNPVDGEQYSFPIPNYPMDQHQFELLALTSGNGIIDRGDYPYWLVGHGSNSETNAKNSMILKVGQSTDKAEAVVAGYYHVLTKDMEIPLPAVTSTTTYRICLTYDQRDDEERIGPVSVQVYTTEPPVSFARIHCTLYTVTRRPNELLTDAVVERFRPRTVAPIAVLQKEHLPDARNVLFGSVAFIYGNGSDVQPDIMIARGASTEEGGPNRWDSMFLPEWTNLGDNIYYGWAGHGYKRGYCQIGNMVYLRGHIKLVGGGDFLSGGGSNTAGYAVLSLPARLAPAEDQRFIAATNNYSGNRLAVITISKDGTVYAMPILGDAAWISLDGINFALKD